MRAHLHVLAALLCLALLGALACNRVETPTPTPRAAASEGQVALPMGEAAPDRLAAAPATQALPADVQRGVCLAHNYQWGGRKGYGTEASAASKERLKALGTDWISLTPFGWMKSKHSSEVMLNPHISAGESDARLEREVAQARQMGFKIMLKPHIWISYTEWRGHIEPTDGGGWERWFETYTAFIMHYARLAQRLELDALVIGLELASASPKREPWLKLIEEIRAVYDGPLVYAANWNETDLVAFWDKVDWIGVQFFAPLSDSMAPTYDELAASLNKHFDAYEPLAKKYNKPVILTEYGYKSIVATTASPGTWPEHLPESARAYDETNQALAFKALFNTVSQRRFIKGVYLWKWFTDVETDEEGRIGFSPWKKRAEQVMAEAHAAPSPPPSQPAQ